MIAGEATFAEIARRDVATQAEVFGGGQAVIGEAAFLAMERRNVLEFIERNFEVVLVVCGELALRRSRLCLRRMRRWWSRWTARTSRRSRPEPGACVRRALPT